MSFQKIYGSDIDLRAGSGVYTLSAFKSPWLTNAGRANNIAPFLILLPDVNTTGASCNRPSDAATLSSILVVAIPRPFSPARVSSLLRSPRSVAV